MSTIQEVLSKLRIPFLESGHKHSRVGWIQLEICPFCNSHNYHLGYNLSTGYFHCWRCRGHHPMSVLVRLGLNHQEAQAFWKGQRNFELPAEKPRTGLKEPKYGKLLGAHREYLRSRGFEPKEISDLWQVGGLGIAGHLSWRLYIPILLNDERVSWTTRAVGDGIQQRYLSASAGEESVNHKSLLYGADYCLHSAIVVEGPVDAWRIGPGAVAVLGTAYSTSQVNKLLKYPLRVICFDSEPGAQRVAKELAAQLSGFPGKTLNVELDANDPGTASKKEVRLLRKIARL